MSTNTKYWSLTWETNIKQKKIPDEDKLITFLNQICTEACFQYEEGTLKRQLHIQGVISLEGPRQSKIATLNLFREHFKNIAGLTLTPVYDKVAISAYVTKPEGRIKGPFYAGKNERFDMTISKLPLRHWQQNLFELLISDELPNLKDRKVIWVEDTSGNTGKSWFQKWLRLAQKKLIVRSLPVSNVDRLMSAVHIINKNYKVDVYCIDLTRTQGEDQSFKDLFSAIEQIKNGSAIDLMYGKYNETYFDPPVVMIFTNQELKDYHKYLSADRWLHLKIRDNQLYKQQINKYPYVELVGKKQKNNSDQVDSNQSIELDSQQEI